jgi:uncharacterized protein YbjT (DUF2867 family)
MATILITGGTGTLGRQVVSLLSGGDHELRVLTRQTRRDADRVSYATGDLATGSGIRAAVDGVSIIVHCAGSARGDEQKALNLVRAAQALTGAPHLLSISVAGADRVPVSSVVDRAMFGYFPMKLATEHVVRDSGLPWTVVRATQFYDLILKVSTALAKPPIVPVPAGMPFQPIDPREVAQRIVELTLAPPAGLVAEIAGPKVYELPDLIRPYLRAAGKRRTLVPVVLPGKAARAIRGGAVTVPGPAYGRRTWEDFLGETMPSAA